jgi:hypothetical protein
VAMMKKGTGSAEQTNPKKRRDLVLEWNRQNSSNKQMYSYHQCSVHNGILSADASQLELIFMDRFAKSTYWLLGSIIWIGIHIYTLGKKDGFVSHLCIFVILHMVVVHKPMRTQSLCSCGLGRRTI